ncbi:MAG TPA: NUDIX domain-containing protein [Micromonospora sp.]|nr:NUDIX domain-containing protein [Micromonospora sp.]
MNRSPVEVAVVLLVDRSGALLLQLRDGRTPVYPHHWCLPGGLMEPGEDPQQAAERELWEETMLRADDGLRIFARQELPDPDRVMHYFFGSTCALQEDVVLGEGAAMLFVPADELLARNFTPGTAQMLTRFLASPEYAELAATGDDRAAVTLHEYLCHRSRSSCPAEPA